MPKKANTVFAKTERRGVRQPMPSALRVAQVDPGPQPSFLTRSLLLVAKQRLSTKARYDRILDGLAETMARLPAFRSAANLPSGDLSATLMVCTSNETSERISA
jgi:hypothetical protein